MTIEINLLPWRALKRKQERKALIALVLFLLGLGFMVLFSINYYVETLTHNQRHRNNRLQEEIGLLHQQIQEINKLIGVRQLLLSRMRRVTKLQLNRVVIVHFFDELVRIVPDSIYLTYAQRIGDQIKVFGSAESNNIISRMMRHIELNSWFQKPSLTEIKQSKIPTHPAVNEFKLSFILRGRE